MEMVGTKRGKPMLLPVDQVMDRVGLGRSTVLKEMYAGRMRSEKVGARRLVHPDDLQAWIDQLRAEAHGSGQSAA